MSSLTAKLSIQVRIEWESVGSTYELSVLSSVPYFLPLSFSKKRLPIVMNAWVRCGDVVEAEKLLCIVENLGEAGEDICPNVVSYSTVMNGYVS